MIKPKIGLLPLYIELYDKAVPDVRGRIDAFHEIICAELEKRGVEVFRAPVCRLTDEFAAAVGSFEKAGAQAIVTLHLAYSPSLESAEALAKTKLPIIIVDTTPTYEYGPGQDPAELMYNHGIHGVQDMCNLLIRNGKPFQIEAGHWEKSDVLDRVAGWARAARLAAGMRSARVGRIGRPFAGMGDFAVPEDVMRSTIGVETVPCDADLIRSLLPAPDDAEVDEEIRADLAGFATDGLEPECHRRTARVCLAVRRWIENQKFSAFTVNFLEVNKASGLPTVPFLEASKAMSRGIGYAGEGDVLTSALVGALASVFPDTTFTEMFCPDWAGDSIFLNHMGEMNVNLAEGKPRLKEMPFPWTDADNPAFAVGRFRAGEGCLVNLAPGPNDTYTLIAAPVTMLDIDGEDRMAELIHGWFRPDLPIADFLEDYCRVGGTHHLALVYGDVAVEILMFGELMGWDVVLLE